MILKRYILILISLLTIVGAKAQNNTGTPYSVFGYGLINENPGPYTGLGGVSAAMRDNININYMNPASYTALDSNRWHVQLGINAEMARISTHKETSHYRVAQNGYFNMGFRIMKNLYASMGFTEFSDIGYNLTYTNGIPGSLAEKYTQSMVGEGGLNQFHFGLGWKLKNLSIGANLGAVFGKIERRQTLSIPIEDAYLIKSSDNNRIHDIIITMGAQYEIPFAGNQMIILGGTFNANSKLFARRTFVAYKESTSSSSIIDNDDIQQGFIKFPYKVTAGITWTKGTRWLVSADYTFQKMSKYSEFGVDKNLEDYHRGAFGISYTPEKHSRKWYLHNSYEFGAYMVRSHILLNSHYINTYALTAGTVIPFLFSNNRQELDLKVSVDVGFRGTEADGLIHERFTKLRLSFAFKELWFMKRKIY